MVGDDGGLVEKKLKKYPGYFGGLRMDETEPNTGWGRTRLGISLTSYPFKPTRVEGKWVNVLQRRRISWWYV